MMTILLAAALYPYAPPLDALPLKSAVSPPYGAALAGGLSAAAWYKASNDPKVTVVCTKTAELGGFAPVVAVVGLILASRCTPGLPKPYAAEALRSARDPLK